LLAVCDEWQAEADRANTQAAHARLGDQSRAAYQRGMAKAYETAATTLRSLLRQDVPAEEGGHSHSVVPIDKLQVRKMLELGGWRFTQLYAHNDNTFSVVFPRSLMTSFEDRMVKLKALHPALIILQYGTLP